MSSVTDFYDKIRELSPPINELASLANSLAAVGNITLAEKLKYIVLELRDTQASLAEWHKADTDRRYKQTTGDVAKVLSTLIEVGKEGKAASDDGPETSDGEWAEGWKDRSENPGNIKDERGK
jgi:hypothetical protein